MKLRNKLIPLMSVLTATTVVAPIASCSANNYANDGILDITKPYTPTIARAEKKGDEENPVSKAEAYDLYMTKAMENPEIIQQDIWYYESKKLPERISRLEHTYIDVNGAGHEDYSTQYNTVTNVAANVVAKDVEVKRVKGIIEGIETEFYTLSMVMGYNYQFTATSIETEPRVQLTKSISYTSIFKDVPLSIGYNSNNWFIYTDLLSDGIDEYLRCVPGWSVNYDLSTAYDCNVSTHGLTQTYTDGYSYTDTITRRSQIIALKQGQSTLASTLKDYFPRFGSYYLTDVAHPNQDIDFAKDVYTLEAVVDKDHPAYAVITDPISFEISGKAKELMNSENLEPRSVYINGIRDYDEGECYFSSNDYPYYGDFAPYKNIQNLNFQFNIDEYSESETNPGVKKLDNSHIAFNNVYLMTQLQRIPPARPTQWLFSSYGNYEFQFKLFSAGDRLGIELYDHDYGYYSTSAYEIDRDIIVNVKVVNK